MAGKWWGSTLGRIAFTMQLNSGQAAEYKRRHDDIWPELVDLLKDSGVSDYTIFLDEASHTLFAVLRRSHDHRMDELRDEQVMQRWWDYMCDIMATDDLGVPQTVTLREMFHMD